MTTVLPESQPAVKYYQPFAQILTRSFPIAANIGAFGNATGRVGSAVVSDLTSVAGGSFLRVAGLNAIGLHAGLHIHANLAGLQSPYMRSMAVATKPKRTAGNTASAP